MHNLVRSIVYVVWGVFLLGYALCCVSCAPESSSTSVAEQECVIKVGTYNLWCSHSRNKYLSQYPEIDRQRYWAPSSGAVAAIVEEMDCDIFAFQEIGDSIYGKAGFETSLRNLIGEGKYKWLIFSNVDGTEVTPASGRLSYSPGICYKDSLFTFLGGGVFWLGGNPSKPEFVRTESFDPELGDPKRACVWARMRHRASGKLFYFLSAHLDTRSFGGVSYPMVNVENCKNLMYHADWNIVPEGVPSIIAADMNSRPTDEGYITYLSTNEGRRHKWEDTYELASQGGVLGKTASESPVTVNSSKGVKGNSRIDHILTDGFDVLEYEINQKKYNTENGAEHYPSDHFPVTVKLKFR